MPVNIEDVRAIVEAQERWRGHQTINLIASENAQSPAVRAIQNSDFMARYAEGHPNRGDEVHRYYQGTRYIDQIETMAREELLALRACARRTSGRSAATPRTRRSPWATCAAATRHRQLDAGGRPHQPQHHRRHRPAHPEPRPLAQPRRAEAIPLHFFPLTEDGITSTCQRAST